MIWIVAIVAVVAIGAFMLYNALVTMRNMVRNAWADVDVQLKKRSDLIPNLVTCVKSYATHEASVLTAVSEARTLALSQSGATPSKAEAERSLGQAVFNVQMLAEAYPELKAGDNFQRLQNELTDAERTIASARQYYNACVRDYNTKRESFPNSLLAGSFEEEMYFELEDSSQSQVPDLSSG
jgi:LemA protein